MNKPRNMCTVAHTYTLGHTHTHTHSFPFQSSNPSSYINSHGGEREEKDKTRKDVLYDLVVPLTMFRHGKGIRKMVCSIVPH